MTVGGNAAAKEYFNKYPGSDTKDAKTKYSSKIGLAYKEKLAQKVKDDLIAYVLPLPQLVILNDICVDRWIKPQSIIDPGYTHENRG